MEKIFLHIDVNNAFLSWTAVDLLKKGSKIDIRNIDAVIGHEREKQGIVLAKSTPAKKKGVVTPEPIYKAKRKVRNLKVVEPDYKVYKEMSEAFFSLIANYFYDYEKMSIDECYVDYTSYKTLYKDPVEFAYKLQKEIYQKLGFTVNVGVANCKLCAKMASDLIKPNKVNTIFDYEIKEKMWPLKIEDLYMVGKKTVEVLKKLEINTIGDLANYDENKLRLFFKDGALRLKKSANGIDDSSLGFSTMNKGFSRSTTFDYDVASRELIDRTLKELVGSIALSLRKNKVYAKTVGITIRTNEFITKNKQIKLVNATNVTKEIYKVALKLLDQVIKGESIRLIGASVTNLTIDKDVQISIFEKATKKDENIKLQEALDSINEKYGFNSIMDANLKEKK